MARGPRKIGGYHPHPRQERMNRTHWRSMGLILAAALVGAGCGKDSTGPDPAENAAPTADFSSSCTDLACSFTDLSTDSDGDVMSYAWQFGERGHSSQRNPSHTFAAAGAVNVTLTVTDNGGDEAAGPGR